MQGTRGRGVRITDDSGKGWGVTVCGGHLGVYRPHMTLRKGGTVFRRFLGCTDHTDGFVGRGTVCREHFGGVQITEDLGGGGTACRGHLGGVQITDDFWTLCRTP